MFKAKVKKSTSVLMLSLFLVSSLITIANADDLTDVKNHINSMRGSSEELGIFGEVLTKVFGTGGLIKGEFTGGGTNADTLDGLDSTDFQRAPIASCGSGSSISSISLTGAVTCEIDDIGAGGGGGTANANTLNYVSKSDGSDLVDSIIFDNGTSIGVGTETISEVLTVNGRISVSVDPNSGDDLGDRDYNDARYLGIAAKASDSDTLDGNDTAYFQRRVTGTCSGGASLTAVNADGTVSCGTSSVNVNTTNYVSKSDGSNLVDSLIFDNGTSVGIGTATPGQELEVNGDILADSIAFSSDLRYKTNIVSIESALDKVTQIGGYTYEVIKTGTMDMGVIAQEVEKEFPLLVNTNELGYKSVKYANLIAPIIESIKELYFKVIDQSDKINSLELKLEQQQKDIDFLKKQILELRNK